MGVINKLQSFIQGDKTLPYYFRRDLKKKKTLKTQ